jgi:hypothetical protein
MHIKFFGSGQGGGSGPTKYLTAEAVYKEGELKQRDPLPEVMRGDVAQTCALIDSSQNEWKYTSGVIAFHRDDAPTEAQQRQVMDDFERLAFAGLEPDQYDILWVRHTHEGNTELHMVTPRLELNSGKALNIAPPGHLATFDSLRDAWNYENGWARPDDPERQRLVSAPEQTQNPLLADRKTAREDITAWLVQRVKSGLVGNREDVLGSLAEIGEITRTGKDYISVKPAGFDKAIRLKGSLYEEKFDAGAIKELAGEGESRGRTDPALTAEAARTARRELESHVNRRADYNAARYSPGRGEIERNNGPISRGLEGPAADHAGRDAEPAGHVDAVVEPQQQGRRSEPALVVVAGDRASPGSLSGHLERELGADRIPDTADIELAGRRSAEPAGVGELAGGSAVRDFGRGGVSVAEKETGDLPDRIQRMGSEIKQIIQVGYDRIRDKISRVITNIRDGIERARDSFHRAGEQLTGHREQLAGAVGGFNAAVSDLGRTAKNGDEPIQRHQPTVSRGITAVRGNRTDELERFKQDISLAEYAAGEGYVLVKNESSRNSFVMQRETDHDKIIVATGTDGHGIYFSVRDDADNGSIIDFVQKRKGLNLGQVRQELRPHAGENREARPIETQLGKPKASTQDTHKAAVNWSRAQPAPGHDYLERRGIKKETLQDPRFAPVIRADERGNALFAHYNREGISGFEIKNKDFTGFAAGGQKSLWFSSNINHAERVIVTESAIDALSHAELERGDKGKDPQKTAYVSFGGAMSPEQKELIASLFEKVKEKGQKLALGTDRDAGGEAFNTELMGLLPEGLEATLERPSVNTKDWNESLRQQQTVDRYRQDHGSRNTPSNDHGMSM